jgi:hypothetical protein
MITKMISMTGQYPEPTSGILGLAGKLCAGEVAGERRLPAYPVSAHGHGLG